MREPVHGARIGYNVDGQAIFEGCMCAVGGDTEKLTIGAVCRIALPGLAVAILLLIAVDVGYAFFAHSNIMGGELADPDAYSRLNRVRDLWQTGDWFDARLPRVYPPEGHLQHWTRPLDALLLAGALGLAPFFGFDTGLHITGAVISPIFHVAVLFAVAWAAAPLVERREWLAMAPVVLVLQPVVFGDLVVGLPDHHGLVLLFLCVGIGHGLRMILAPERLTGPIGAGAAFGIALWVSVEALPLVAIFVISCGISWLVSGSREKLMSVFVHALALFATVTIAVLLERGPGGYADVWYDTLSLAHIVLFGLNAAYWGLLYTVTSRVGSAQSAGVRIILAGFLGAGALVSVYALQPGFFADPLANVDPLYRTVRMERIQEIQPLFAGLNEGESTVRALLAKPLMYLGLALVAFPWAVYRFAVRTGTARAMWVFMGLASIALTVLTIRQARWATQAELLLAFVYADFVASVLWKIGNKLSGQTLLYAVRPVAAIGLVTWHLIPGLAIPTGAVAKVKTQTCPITELASFLGDPQGLGARPRLVLAHTDFGPEILYRTEHSVFSIPNHRPQPGFRAAYDIMTAPDAATARRRLEATGAGLIVVCYRLAPGESSPTTSAGDRKVYFDLLATGATPEFLTPVTLPPALEGQARILIVKGTD